MNLRDFLSCVFRSYGQLFLAPRVATGVLFLMGLLVLSPRHALYSVLGLLLITVPAWFLLPRGPVVRSGLLGVNGVLLGLVWVLFPEIPAGTQLLLTVGGSLILALVLIPTLRCWHKQAAPLALGTFCYVMVVWLSMAVLSSCALYDRSFLAGWTELAAHKSAAAGQHFAAMHLATPQGQACRQDGLGWSQFHLQQYGPAVESFQTGINLWPELADLYDGLGWSYFRQGRFLDAQGAFGRAVVRDPLLADSWDGLGWVALATGQPAEAQRFFRQAAASAPLFADAYTGWQRTFALAGNARAADRCAPVSAWLTAHVDSRYQRTSVAQLMCWVLFVLGLALHSRISGLLATVGVAACVLGAYLFPTWADTLLDIGFIYNLVALLVALGGHYLRLNYLTALYLVLASAGLAVFWHGAAPVFLNHGLPLLCLPFTLFLTGSVLLLAALERRGLKNYVVPLEIAVTTPYQVGLWAMKSALVQSCWKRIAASNAHSAPNGECPEAGL